MKLGGIIGPALVILVPYLLFESLKNSSFDIYYVAPHGHFYIVSIVALLSTMIGIAVGVAGSRLRNIKVSFLSLAFISLAGFFSVHGLATPGFLINAFHIPGIAVQLSILLATLWLFLSSLSSDHILIEYISRWKNKLVPVWTISLGVFCIIWILLPYLSAAFPFDQNPFRVVLTMVVLLLNLYTMYSYFKSYRYSKFPLQISIVYSAGLFIVSQWVIVTSELWRLSWWTYHFLLLASMIVMLTGFYKQYAANKSFIHAIQALFTTDPVERITNCISPSVKALILATESKDTYTAGHNFRVTMYALRIADELGLQPEQLRALVQGTIIHDVGKINIPDSILNKPGSLTEGERKIIQQHPVTGYEMCKNLGFMIEELNIIRHHHERWDGKGYPDGLEGNTIPYLARIVAVADVYDALTTKRAYRKAWTHEEAIQFLNDQKNSHFDQSCVDAWVRICDRNPQIYVHEELQMPLFQPSKSTVM